MRLKEIGNIWAEHDRALRPMLRHPMKETAQNARGIVERRYSGRFERSDEPLGRILGGAGPHTLEGIVEDEGCRSIREEGDQRTSCALGFGLPHLGTRYLNGREASCGTLSTGEWHLRHALGIECRGPGARTAIRVLGTLSAESPRLRVIACQLTRDSRPGGSSRPLG